MSRPSPLQGDNQADLSDEQLACRTQAGSSSCFAELVARHEGRLLSFLRRRLPTVEDAEDLLQETFARAYQQIDRYDPTWKLSTWLFTIAARLAASHLRRRRMPAIGQPRDARAHDDDPPAIVTRREERDNLWGLAARTLTQGQLAALWLRYAESMSVKEISQVLGKTQTHVKVLLFRGRSALGRQLEAAGAAAAAWSAGPATAACGPSTVKGGG